MASSLEKTPLLVSPEHRPPSAPTLALPLPYYVTLHPPGETRKSPRKRFWKAACVSLVVYAMLRWLTLGAFLIGREVGHDESHHHRHGRETSPPALFPQDLPDSDGRLITPIEFGPSEPYNEGNHSHSHYSSLAKPLHLDPTASRHFLKILGPQSIGRVFYTIASPEENDQDVTIRVRAVYFESDREWAEKDLSNIVGGAYDEAEDGASGVALQTPATLFPSNPQDDQRRNTLRFLILVSVPTFNSNQRLEFFGNVFGVSLAGLAHQHLQQVSVETRVGSIEAEHLTSPSIAISTLVGSISGSFATTSTVSLSTSAGPIEADISLLPASLPYSVTLSSQAGNVTASFPVQPLHSTLHAQLTSHAGHVVANLAPDGFEGAFEGSSVVGEVFKPESGFKKGRMVEVHEEKAKWTKGGKVWGVVRWWPIGKGDGKVVATSEIGSVTINL